MKKYNFENYRLHIAINARGLVNRKDFSLLLWQREAFTKKINDTTFTVFAHRINLITAKPWTT